MRDLDVLHVGKGWLVDQPGGLNRYFHDLVGTLDSNRGLVVGPASNAPERIVGVGTHNGPLLKRLVQLYRASDAEGVAILDAHFAIYALPVLARQPSGVGLIVHFHGPWASEASVEGASRFVIKAKRAVERHVYRRADRCIVLSPDFATTLAREYGVSPQLIDVVPPGVNLDHFQPAPTRSVLRRSLKLDERTKVVIAARRLVPRMGLGVLLDAWSRLADDDNPPRRLVIIGDGPERSALERQVERLGIERNVTFLGRCSDEELVRWYQAADLSVVPSVALEGFGLVVLESLACGTPVIASRLGGLPESLRTFREDLLVPPGNAPLLARRIDAALAGVVPDRCDARRHAETFSWQRTADRHREIYATVASARSKRRVVFVDHTARLSGGELALARLLPSLDVEPIVLLGEEGPLVGRLLDLGIRTEVLPLGSAVLETSRHSLTSSGLGRRALEGARGVAGLTARIHQLAPDLVHTNSLKAALLGGLAAKAARVPCVWHMRDRLASDYMSDGSARLMRAAGLALPAAVIANSACTMSCFGDKGPAIRAVIPSPIDVDGLRAGARFREALSDDSARRYTVAMIGRIAPWKGQHVVLEAVGQLPCTVRLRIIGAVTFGEDDYLGELKDTVARMGFDERVTFDGFRDDIGQVLSEADVLVHASIAPEPLGQVVLEAMAAGCPVIAADAGGIREHVQHQETGLLHSPGDSRSLAELIRSLMDDSRLASELADRAMTTTHRYRPTTVARQVEEVYAAVLGDR